MSGAILAIDPGGQTGWAARQPGRSRLHVGTLDLDPKRVMQRSEAFLAHLRRLHASFKPSILAIEQPQTFRSRSASWLLYGFAQIAWDFARDKQLQWHAVNPMTLKKFATGTGRADKAKMLKAARKRFRRSIANDHEADALWVLEYVRSHPK